MLIINYLNSNFCKLVLTIWTSPDLICSVAGLLWVWQCIQTRKDMKTYTYKMSSLEKRWQEFSRCEIALTYFCLKDLVLNMYLNKEFHKWGVLFSSFSYSLGIIHIMLMLEGMVSQIRVLSKNRRLLFFVHHIYSKKKYDVCLKSLHSNRNNFTKDWLNEIRIDHSLEFPTPPW